MLWPAELCGDRHPTLHRGGGLGVGLRILWAATTLFSLGGPQNAAADVADAPAAPQPSLSLIEIVRGAIGPYFSRCDGYGNPGASGLGYISVITLHAGETTKELSVPGQAGEGLDGTLAFDRAEASGAYIGQINLVVSSSFSGPSGAIWGYNIARAFDTIGTETLFEVTTSSNKRIPVYALDPLLDAGSRLFGMRDAPRFPILPGAHVMAAHKGISAVGPTNVWCGLAIGIAEERARNANLIMELCGEFKPQGSGESKEPYFRLVRQNLAKSVVRVGENQNVTFAKMFVGVIDEEVREGSVGYAMATVPYVVLARDAIPDGGPEKLLEMNISEWEKVVRSRMGADRGSKR
ncbi:Histidine decarboxylase proenzyme [Methylocystis sp. MJC1]|nr:Histidine decarboxylase proenzyme [Methylocystis sp. MJC1]